MLPGDGAIGWGKFNLHYWVWQGALRAAALTFSASLDPLQKLMRAVNSLPHKAVCVHTISQLG